jgi:hypothetical protein
MKTICLNSSTEEHYYYSELDKYHMARLGHITFPAA